MQLETTLKINALDKAVNNSVAKNKRKKVTLTELSLLLQQVDGRQATMIGMFTVTKVTNMRKTNNPYANDVIEKVTYYNGMINANYTNSVNNQREREGKEADFQATENWHAKKYDEINGCVARHKAQDNGADQEYLLFQPNPNGIKRITMLRNGVECTKEEMEIIKSFIPVKKPSLSQGTEKEVLFQTFKLQSIRVLKMNKKTFAVDYTK